MFSQSYWNKKYPKKANESVVQHRDRVYKKRLQYMCYELNIAYHEDYAKEELQMSVLETLVDLYQNRDISENSSLNFLEGV